MIIDMIKISNEILDNRDKSMILKKICSSNKVVL